MVLKFLQRRRQRGGQFVAFDKGVDTKKVTWLKTDPMDIVEQMMTKERDATDSTAQMSSQFLEHSDSDSSSNDSDTACCYGEQDSHCEHNDSDSTFGCLFDQAQDEGNTDDAEETPSRRPTWLKRPMFSDICSNHALVNAERQWGDNALHPLKRSQELDELARWHAQAMAAEGHSFHSDPKVLCSKMQSQPQARLGENVARGKSMRVLHSTMKKHASNYANMMDERYTEMGMATARSADGEWYLCQIFRG